MCSQGFCTRACTCTWNENILEGPICSPTAIKYTEMWTCKKGVRCLLFTLMKGTSALGRCKIYSWKYTTWFTCKQVDPSTSDCLGATQTIMRTISKSHDSISQRTKEKNIVKIRLPVTDQTLNNTVVLAKT